MRARSRAPSVRALSKKDDGNGNRKNDQWKITCAVLIDNLPVGTKTSQFEFVGKPCDNAALVVHDNKLMIEPKFGSWMPKNAV
jgi:hypothetical protein